MRAWDDSAAEIEIRRREIVEWVRGLPNIANMFATVCYRSADLVGANRLRTIARGVVAVSVRFEIGRKIENHLILDVANHCDLWRVQRTTAGKTIVVLWDELPGKILFRLQKEFDKWSKSDRIRNVIRLVERKNHPEAETA